MVQFSLGSPGFSNSPETCTLLARVGVNLSVRLFLSIYRPCDRLVGLSRCYPALTLCQLRLAPNPAPISSIDKGGMMDDVLFTPFTFTGELAEQLFTFY